MVLVVLHGVLLTLLYIRCVCFAGFRELQVIFGRSTVAVLFFYVGCGRQMPVTFLSARSAVFLFWA